MVVHVIKRDGHLEKFDQRKILLQCFEACMNAQLSRKECEKISEAVANKLKKQLKTKKEVRSDYIFIEVIKLLKKRSKDAAFMFETHRDIS